MQSIRRSIRRVVGGCLVLHLSILVSAPTALCVAMPDRASAAACTCAHTDGQMCPMHHPASKQGSKSCSCRSTTDPLASLVASLFGPSAVLPADSVLTVRLVASDVQSAAISYTAEVDIVPDAPPPRT
jgi:hypothetical protein